MLREFKTNPYKVFLRAPQKRKRRSSCICNVFVELERPYHHVIWLTKYKDRVISWKESLAIGKEWVVATVLLTYEFGGGLGHLNRLMAIARRLPANLNVFFAVPEVVHSGRLIQNFLGRSFSILQAPKWKVRTDIDAPNMPTDTFADVLDLFAYGDVTTLANAESEWQELVGTVKPDLIIADFAPTLRLSVADSIPTIVLGNGYTVPPAGRILPSLRPWRAQIPPSSRACEGRILSALNEVRSRNGGFAIDYVSDLFSGNITFPGTLPEFDPYHAYRRERTSWPINVPDIAPGELTRSRTGAEIFVYLPSNHPYLESLLEVLKTLRYRSKVYVPGGNYRTVNQVEILSEPADLASVLPQTRLIIHHGGLGTAFGGLASGTPQLVLPLNLEHLVTSRSLIETGVALGISGAQTTKDDLRYKIDSLLISPTFSLSAQNRAGSIAKERDPDPSASIVDACRIYL